MKTKILAILFFFGSAALPVFAQVADDYGTANSGSYCPKLSITMQRGARDVSYSGQVSELQKFLSDYYDIDPEEIVTGFFGRITQGYVQQFQREQGLPSFGIAGSMTRAAIARVCTSKTTSVTPPVVNPTQPNPTPTANPTPITSPSPSVYLYANPTSIVSDGKPGTITLYWSSLNATYCNFEKSKLSPSGSTVVSLSQTTTYTISCTGAGGTNSSNAVTVPFQLTQQLPSADLKVNNSDGPLAKASGYSTFSWTSTNSDYCTASGDTYWSGTKSTSGSETVWTGNEKTGMTTYTITCGASSGKVSSASDSVTITFLPSPTVDLKINNSDGPLRKSTGYSTFSWTSANADYCTASGDTYWSGAKSTNGSENVWTGNEKTGVTTYQLTCGASSGKVNPSSDSVTVNFSY